MDPSLTRCCQMTMDKLKLEITSLNASTKWKFLHLESRRPPPYYSSSWAVPERTLRHIKNPYVLKCSAIITILKEFDFEFEIILETFLSLQAIHLDAFPLSGWWFYGSVCFEATQLWRPFWVQRYKPVLCLFNLYNFLLEQLSSLVLGFSAKL